MPIRPDSETRLLRRDREEDARGCRSRIEPPSDIRESLLWLTGPVCGLDSVRHAASVLLDSLSNGHLCQTFGE